MYSSDGKDDGDIILNYIFFKKRKLKKKKKRNL